MPIRHFPLDISLNFKKVICFVFVFIFNQIARGQCATPIVGCPNVNLSNFGSESNNDAATIEYDNFVSSFHTTVVRTSDGSFQVWGEKIANNGSTDVLAPLTINKLNFPALTGIPLKVALGSNSTGNIQGILLATDGLYAWSKEGTVISNAITSSTTFQKLTINGNSNGLPTDVNPQDVKMMFATYKTLAITTCSGDVWVLSQTATVRGNGGRGNSVTWYRVTTSTTGNPFLTGIVACRGNNDGLMALKSDGTVYVWGNNVLLGNNSPVIPSQDTAIQMTLPLNTIPKMIGSTGNGTARSYFILARDGNLYSVGENSNSELGDWTVTDRLSWVQPRYSSATGRVMNDIKWFSPQEHDSQYGAINVINNRKSIYAFGNNSLLMGAAGSTSNPVIPNGLKDVDQILAVETGGHTSMVVKNCEAKFGYVGHRYHGSMGDGSNINTNELSYTFATAPVQICGVESLPIIQPLTAGTGPDMKYCVNDPVLLDPTPAGGKLTIRSGPGKLAGNTLSFTAAGTVVVQYLVTTSCGGTSLVSKSFDSTICPLDLEVTKTVDNLNPSIGGTSIFTIEAKNNGPYKTTGVIVKDVLPSGYVFVSANPSIGTWSPSNWNIGNLSNGETATIEIVATVKASGTYANTATITANDPDTNMANNTSTVRPTVQSNLSIAKTISNSMPNVGENIRFSITASNAGPSAATRVSVIDVLPSGYTFVSATPSTGTWSSPNWVIGGLANGATAVLKIVARVNATGEYNNTASIKGAEHDPSLVDNSSSVSINHAPVAVDDIYTVTEDATLVLTPLNLDSDSDGDRLTITSINGTALNGTTQLITVANGTVNIAATGVITFTPDANFNSPVAIRIPYLISDGKGGTATANMYITVTGVNDNPVAVDDIYTIAENETVTLNPLNLDSDLDGNMLSVTSINGTTLTSSVQVIPVTHGIVNKSAAGVITFTPDKNFNSATAISIPYVISDGNGGSATANQLITVTAVNDNPVAVDDIYIVAEDETATLNPLNLDSDPDGDTLTITSINGTVLTGFDQMIIVPNAKVNVVAGLITFMPDVNYNSATPISFPYIINDGNGGTATANQLITVKAVNDNPVAADHVNAPILSTSGATPINKLTASDVDGTILSYTILSLPVHGVLALSGVPLRTNQVLTSAQAAMLTYDPSGTFVGNDRFTFTARDNQGGIDSSPATITLVISAALLEAVEDPIWNADGINGSLEIGNVLDNDKLNGNPVTASQVIIKAIDSPAGIVINADGTIDVAPGTQAGNHTFSYQICEVANPSNCSTATVRVFVEIPAVAIVKKGVFNDDNGNGYTEVGETLTYTFEIANKGNSDLVNITVTDPLPGIAIIGGPINLAIGQIDNSSIRGTYALTQADLNAGTISNQAIASGVSKSGIMVMDKSDSSDFNGEKPTVLEFGDCLIKIFNAVSANGDENNSRFYIQGLECYPDNTVQIYNRSGILVFERNHYNNNDIAFRGISEGAFAGKYSSELEEGTYFYIIRYKDKQSKSHEKTGYLYLSN
jgi:uncharacterized repeat protein (TIGR01451 family)